MHIFIQQFASRRSIKYVLIQSNGPARFIWTPWSRFYESEFFCSAASRSEESCFHSIHRALHSPALLVHLPFNNDECDPFFSVILAYRMLALRPHGPEKNVWSWNGEGYRYILRTAVEIEGNPWTTWNISTFRYVTNCKLYCNEKYQNRLLEKLIFQFVFQTNFILEYGLWPSYRFLKTVSSKKMLKWNMFKNL